jgi:hypothetical protein
LENSKHGHACFAPVGLDRAEVVEQIGRPKWLREPLSFASTWAAYHLALLRMKPESAAGFRAEGLTQARSLGLEEDPSNIVEIPGDVDALLFPGLKRAESAAGLRSSLTAPLDDDFAEFAHDAAADPELLRLILIANCCALLAERDVELLHALKALESYGVFALESGDQRSRYRSALVQRTREVVRTKSDPRACWLARVDLDEALHSLFHDPPAQPDSWWGKLLYRARVSLGEAARQARKELGAPVQYRVLRGLYRTVRAECEGDVEMSSAGAPGEVVACLRVPTTVGGRTYPGRVLFHPLRGAR